MIVRAALTGLGKAWFDDLVLMATENKKSSQPQPQSPAGQESSGTSAEKPGKQISGRIVETVPVTKDCMILAYIPKWGFGNIDNLCVANNDGGVRVLAGWPAEALKKNGVSNYRYLLAFYSRKTTSKPGPGRVGVLKLRKIGRSVLPGTINRLLPPNPRPRLSLLLVKDGKSSISLC